MYWRHWAQQVGIALLFGLLAVLLVTSMDAGTVLWQVVIMMVVTWLSVAVVLNLDFQKRIQQQRMDNKQLLLEVMLSSSPVVVCSLDRRGRITSFSGRGLRASSIDSSQVIGQPIANLFDNSPGYIREVRRALQGEGFVSYQELEGRYYRHHFQAQCASHGVVDAVHCVSVDLTRERELEEQLRLSEKVFANTADAIVVADDRRVIQSVNSSFTEITGFDSEDILGKKLGMPRTASQDVTFYKKVWRDLKCRDSWRGEVWSKRKSGELFSGRMTLKVVRDDDGKISNYVAFFSDITDLKRSQEELRYLANHDALTDLPNRRLFLDRLDQAIKRARRVGDRVAVYFIDLDEFKKINDSLGHHVGDALLKEVGRRLKRIVRQSDTVSRLAGDEFTIVAESVGTNDEVVALAKKILAIFDAPFQHQDREFYVSASVGIGVFPDDGDDMTALMKGADAAMYQAKAEGRNGYYYLSKHQQQEDCSDLFFHAELRMALQRDQLSLVYQPQVRIDTGQVIACEALMRWNHHSRGQVMPDKFIPLAEQAGMMRELGSWALVSACQRMAQWRDEGVDVGQVAVNVALSQLQGGDFAQQVKSALEQYGLASKSLVLEIPERALLVDLDDSRRFVCAMADLGVSVSIDDFGSGKSSYGYLKTLPVGIIKIDQQLMKEIKIGKQNDSLVRAIFGLGEVLDLKVVAEGVERSIQEEFLQGVGCRFAQGYLYGKPMSPDSLSRQLPKNTIS